MLLLHLSSIKPDRSVQYATHYQRWAESGSKGFESESLHFARIRINSSMQWIRIRIRESKS